MYFTYNLSMLSNLANKHLWRWRKALELNQIPISEIAYETRSYIKLLEATEASEVTLLPGFNLEIPTVTPFWLWYDRWLVTCEQKKIVFILEVSLMNSLLFPRKNIVEILYLALLLLLNVTIPSSYKPCGEYQIYYKYFILFLVSFSNNGLSCFR